MAQNHKPFNPSELNKLKDSASRFYHKSVVFFDKNLKQFVGLDTLEKLNSEFSTVVMKHDYKVEGDKVAMCTLGTVVAYFSIEGEKAYIYYLYEDKTKTGYTFKELNIISASKGVNGKHIEILTRMEKYGWMYIQPQVYMPNVVLNIQGGFKSFG